VKQLLQSVRKGEIFLSEVPPPQVRPNGVLVRTSASLLSPGTERAAVEFSQMSLFSKARSRPDLVKQVVDKVRRDGVLEAARVAMARLDRPVPLGYACAGTVIAVGAGVSEFGVGDRVACAGAGYAAHAEVNYVPRNLVVPIPRRSSGTWLSFEEASFAALGAVALHAVRLGHPGIGERVVVIGLGLLGLIAGQILRAHGCSVLGVDPLPARCSLGKQLGVEEVVHPDIAAERVQSFTRGIGADLVIITASATESGPVHLAGEVARDRATVVAVGATGLDLPRRLYYQKELSLVVSRSCGPGRYDPNFEERGQDYPPGYIRWTERENMRAFLELLAENRVLVEPLITHRIPIEEAGRAYGLLGDPDAVGVILQYPASSPTIGEPLGVEPLPIEPRPAPAPQGSSVGVSFIGAGSFAQEVLLPILKRVGGLEFRGVVTASGVSARWAGDRFGFSFCTSDPEAVWRDPGTHAVIIATRNHLHAALVEKGLAAGKAVFVEKPLCISEDELDAVVRAHQMAESSGRSPLVMVGFNRRFAPSVQAVRAFLASARPPFTLHYRVNAGRLPDRSWVADPQEGGGRIISEFCHFVDLSAFMVGAAPVAVFARSVRGGEDDVVATLTFANGSLATIGFYSNGDHSCSKERLEVFGGGGGAVMEVFRRGWLVRGGRRRRIGGFWPRQEKGHREEMQAFLEAVRRSSPSPVPFEEAVRTTRATFAIRESLSRGIPIDLAL